MCKQRDQGKQRQQCRGRAQDRQIQTLPLRFDVQVRTSLFEGHLQLPALNEPLHNTDGIGV